jgi:hypothetical protein
MYDLGCQKLSTPRVCIGCGWTIGEMGTSLVSSTRGTNRAAGGEVSVVEEVTGGVVGAARRADVGVEVIRVVVEPSGGAVRPPGTSSVMTVRVGNQTARGGGLTAILHNTGGQTAWGCGQTT